MLFVITFCSPMTISAAEVESAQIKPVVQTPQDWLLWAKIPGLLNLEEQADKLLEPFGIRLVGAKQILQTYCGNTVSDDRPIVVGLVASKDPSENTPANKNLTESISPELFLILPLDDLERFAETRGFSMQEDLWLTTMLGVEFRITPRDNAIWITRLDTLAKTPTKQQMDAVLSIETEEVETTSNLLQVSLSRSGFNYLLESTRTERKAFLSQPRRNLPALKVPRTLPELREQLTRFVPFLEAIEKIAGQEEGLILDGDLQLQKNSIALNLRLTTDSSSYDLGRQIVPTSPTSLEVPRLAKRLPTQQVISEITSYGTVDSALLELLSGYFFCYPDEVEATAYNEPAYRAYADKLNRLMSAAISIEMIDFLVDASEPLAAGQAILLNFPLNSQPQVEEQMAQLIDLWNRLLVVSRARLKFEAKYESVEFATTSGKKLTAKRVSIDMIEAFGGRRYEEVVALFEAIYGPDCLYRTHLINLNEGRWLISRLSETRNKELVEKLLDKQDDLSTQQSDKQQMYKQPWQLTAMVYPDRYQDWNIRLDEISNSETIGHRPLPAMSQCEPIAINVGRKDKYLTAKIDLPLSTYRSVIEFVNSFGGQ